MKLYTVLASLALFSSLAHANTIETMVNVSPKTGTVQHVNFNVSNAGLFNITASTQALNFNYLSDPFIYLYQDTVSSTNFLQANDDANDYTVNSLISRNLAIGSYILAVSSYAFTPASATSGTNFWVNEFNKGLVDIEINSNNGSASFFIKNELTSVPVPSAIWMICSGLLALLSLRRKII